LDRDRLQEDDLDVEQDEQHRHEAEADPEAESTLALRRQAALVRRLLRAVRQPPLATGDQVEHPEQEAERPAENQEHDRGEVRPEHRRPRYTTRPTSL